jgi:hypothetical protein
MHPNQGSKQAFPKHMSEELPTDQLDWQKSVKKQMHMLHTGALSHFFFLFNALISKNVIKWQKNNFSQ